MFHSTTKPKDGQLFTVYEIIYYMLVDECSFLFGDKSVIGFGRTTLQKAVKIIKKKEFFHEKIVMG
jgi:hypothetical protein